MLKTSSRMPPHRPPKSVETERPGECAESEKSRLDGRLAGRFALLFIINREGVSAARGRLSLEWKKIIAFFHKNNGEALDIQETL